MEENKVDIEIVCNSFNQLREVEYYLFNYKYFEEMRIKVSFRENNDYLLYKTQKITEKGQDFYVIVTEDMKFESVGE